MPAELRADYGGMDVERRRLHDVADAAVGWTQPLRDALDTAVDATGGFQGDLADGAAGFATSWAAVFGVFGDCAGLLAANLGEAVIALRGLDATLASQIGGLAWGPE
jgi:hypothetical protein